MSRIYIDIPEMALGDALLEVSARFDRNIVVPSQLVSGYKSYPVVGNHSLESALRGVLSKSPFGFQVITDENSIRIYYNPVPASTIQEKRISKKQQRSLEEVLVFARLREEPVFDVPMSLDNYTENWAFVRNITTLDGVAMQSTNTVLRVPRGTNSAVSAFIRGIGQDDPLAGFETGVGIYIDGVYLNRPQTPVMDIYNLERIEILKGPQGTLYGRNSIGGAVKYVTKPLEDVPVSSLDLSFGSYNQRDVILKASAPIGDGTAKIGGSIASFQRDGYGKNVNTGQENADKDINAARFNLEIKPHESFSIRVATDVIIDDSNTKSGYRLVDSPSHPRLQRRFDTEAGLEEEYHPVNQNEVFSRGYSSTIEWNANDSFRLDAISAFRSDRVDSAIDFNALPSNNLDVHVRFKNEQFSQEFRFSYSQPNLDLLLGIYYLNAYAFSAFDTEVENFSNFNGVSFSLSETFEKSNSIFVSSIYKFDSSFSASFGLRYTEDSNRAAIEKALYTVTSEGEFVSPYFGGNGFLLTQSVFDENGRQLVPKFKAKRNDSSIVPRVSISCKPSLGAHYYLSYSEGYKSGGFDPRADYSQIGARNGYSPETLDTYELGAKWRGYDEKIHADIALFSGHYKNIQIPGEGDTNYVRNSAEADIDGAELSVYLKMNQRWNFSVKLGLLSSKFSKYDNSNQENVASQRKFINAPEESLSFNIDRIENYAGNGSLRAYYNYIYRSDVSMVREYPTQLYEDNFNISNLGVVWESPKRRYSIGVHLNNIFDEKYLIDGYYYPQFNTVTAFYGDPRTLAVTGTLNLR